MTALPGRPEEETRREADLTREESIALVERLIGGAIRPEMFLLHGEVIEARLTVDPDVALAALEARDG